MENTTYIFKEKARKTRYQQIICHNVDGMQFERIHAIIKYLYPRRPLTEWRVDNHYHIQGNFSDAELSEISRLFFSNLSF